MIEFKKKEPVQMNAEEFGFYQDSGDEEKPNEESEGSNQEEQKTTGHLINKENSYIKDDFAQLSSLCSELLINLSQHDDDEEEEQRKTKKITKSSKTKNVFRKTEKSEPIIVEELTECTPFA